MSIVCAIQQFNVSSVWQISRYLIRLAYFMGTIFLSKVATYFSGKLTQLKKLQGAVSLERELCGWVVRKKGVGPPKWLSWPFWGLRITWDDNRLSFVSPLVVDFHRGLISSLVHAPLNNPNLFLHQPDSHARLPWDACMQGFVSRLMQAWITHWFTACRAENISRLLHNITDITEQG